jgi:hypothetical protein
MDRAISFPCKRAEPAQLDKVILEHIRHRGEGAPREGTSDYSVALAEFAQLRASCVEKPSTANDYNLKALMRFALKPFGSENGFRKYLCGFRSLMRGWQVLWPATFRDQALPILHRRGVSQRPMPPFFHISCEIVW